MTFSTNMCNIHLWRTKCSELLMAKCAFLKHYPLHHVGCDRCCNPVKQGDQNVSVHLTITVQKHAKIQYFEQNTFRMWTMLYWTQSLRTQFSVSINVWRLAGDTLNITCNFLYCNHQVHTDFLITLYHSRSLRIPLIADCGKR